MGGGGGEREQVRRGICKGMLKTPIGVTREPFPRSHEVPTFLRATEATQMGQNGLLPNKKHCIKFIFFHIPQKMQTGGLPSPPLFRHFFFVISFRCFVPIARRTMLCIPWSEYSTSLSLRFLVPDLNFFLLTLLSSSPMFPCLEAITTTTPVTRFGRRGEENRRFFGLASYSELKKHYNNKAHKGSEMGTGWF